jgi:hypothetical protein
MYHLYVQQVGYSQVTPEVFSPAMGESGDSRGVWGSQVTPEVFSPRGSQVTPEVFSPAMSGSCDSEVFSPAMSASTPTDEGETTCTLFSRIQEPGSVCPHTSLWDSEEEETPWK